MVPGGNILPRQHQLHQGPHAQFAGDGQGLVQQGRGLLSVALSVPLKRRVGVVAVARTSMQCFLEVLNGYD